MSPGPLTSPVQYEFISNTGIEDESTKKNLKTVRSHVMRHYLHQQQQRSRQSSSPVASERRRSKQRARSSRSASHEDEEPSSSCTSQGVLDISANGYAGPFDIASGTPPLEFAGIGKHTALEFDYTPPQDIVSCLAQAYASCVARDKQAGSSQANLETLHAKGETMRVVQEMLSVCGDDVPETILFAISTLAYGCSASCEWDEAIGHLRAMQHLITLKGEIQCLDFGLQKFMTSTAFHIGAELLLPPTLPLPLHPNPMPFSLAFQDDAKIRAWRTIKRFPNNSSFVYDVVVRFHQLALAVYSDWIDKVDSCALSNLYFEASHSAVLVQLEEPWSEHLPSGIQGRETATMFKVWAAGLPIFVSTALRHLRCRYGILASHHYHGPIFDRIQAILEKDGGYHAWPRGRNLEPVLATLFYALEACAWDNPWRIWCVNTMRTVMNLLKLHNAKEFKKALDFFPITEIHQGIVDSVWTEMTL